MHHTIDQEKLEQIVMLFNQQVDPEATEEVVKNEICADWNRDTAHQA